MEKPRKQDTDTGSGAGRTPILAKGKPSTEARSKQSQPPSNKGLASTKPVSIPESLSLLQTLCLDLRSMGCEVAILARNSRVYVILSTPTDTGNLTFEKGHIRIDGVPVSVETGSVPETEQK